MLNTSSGRHFTLPNNNVIYISIVICHFKKNLIQEICRILFSLESTQHPTNNRI